MHAERAERMFSGSSYLAVDEPKGDPQPGRERLNSPKAYLHVRPYPERHVKSYADTWSTASAPTEAIDHLRDRAPGLRVRFVLILSIR